jgi:hypothetical protein
MKDHRGQKIDRIWRRPCVLGGLSIIGYFVGAAFRGLWPVHRRHGHEDRSSEMRTVVVIVVRRSSDSGWTSSYIASTPSVRKEKKTNNVRKRFSLQIELKKNNFVACVDW